MKKLNKKPWKFLSKKQLHKKKMSVLMKEQE